MVADISDGTPADERSDIRIEDGQLPRAVDDILHELVFLPPVIFQQGGRLVRVVVLPAPRGNDRGADIHRPDGGVLLVTVEPRWLALTLTRLMRFVRLRSSQKFGASWIEIDCPIRLAETFCALGHWPGLPVLRGLVGAPTLRPDGESVMPGKRGYDQASGLYLTTDAPPGYRAGALSAPTRDDALRAVEVLDGIIGTFPFVAPEDRSAAMSAIITAQVRRLLPAAPLFGVTAHAAGTGKSTLCDIIAIGATGRRVPVMAYPDDQTELDKRLTAALLCGEAIIALDNIERPAKSSLLCQLSTQPMIHVRPLYSAGTTTVPTDALILLDGNNLAVVGDLTRRTVLVRLDANTERPDRRSFDRDPLADAHAHRGGIITAALTIVRAYLAAGSPAVDIEPYGSFAAWDAWCRRPLVWLGLADPLGAADEMRDEDPELAAMRALYAAWYAEYEGQARTAADVLRDAAEIDPDRLDGRRVPAHPQLRDAVHMVLGDRPDTRALGYWLRRHRGRIVDGMRLVSGSGDRHAKIAAWRMELCG